MTPDLPPPGRAAAPLPLIIGNIIEVGCEHYTSAPATALTCWPAVGPSLSGDHSRAAAEAVATWSKVPIRALATILVFKHPGVTNAMQRAMRVIPWDRGMVFDVRQPANLTPPWTHCASHFVQARQRVKGMLKQERDPVRSLVHGDPH